MPVLRIAVISAVGVLAACSGNSQLTCTMDTAYREATSTAPLAVPEGLDVPDETQALRIPERPLDIVDEPDDEECLEMSPGLAEVVETDDG